MILQKNDFVEIEFIARIKNSGEVFDTNIPEEFKKINSQANESLSKPFIFSLGQGMFFKGIDDFLVGKSIDKFPKEFIIELQPENAFGKRNSKLVQLMPMKIFHEQGIRPIQGFQFNFDGRIGKVIAVSGGRVIVDFNIPIAGKEVIYEIKIFRKVEDLNEKINSFLEFLFKKNDIKFSVENKKLIVELEKPFIQFAEMFKDKFKEIFDLDLEVNAKAKTSDKSEVK